MPRGARSRDRHPMYREPGASPRCRDNHRRRRTQPRPLVGMSWDWSVVPVCPCIPAPRSAEHSPEARRTAGKTPCTRRRMRSGAGPAAIAHQDPMHRGKPRFGRCARRQGNGTADEPSSRHAAAGCGPMRVCGSLNCSVNTPCTVRMALHLAIITGAIGVHLRCASVVPMLFHPTAPRACRAVPGRTVG